MRYLRMDAFVRYLAIVLLVSIVLLLLWTLWKMFHKQWRFGVPFIRSKKELIAGFIDNLKMESGQVFLDLGCGDGVVMAAVLERFPGVIAIGYEIVPKVAALGAQYQQRYGKNFSIKTTNYFKEDFSDANVVYCYLLPRLIKPVWEKVKKECKPGTMFYTNAFVLPGIDPIEKIVVPIAGIRDNVLYAYIV